MHQAAEAGNGVVDRQRIAAIKSQAGGAVGDIHCPGQGSAGAAIAQLQAAGLDRGHAGIKIVAGGDNRTAADHIHRAAAGDQVADGGERAFIEVQRRIVHNAAHQAAAIDKLQGAAVDHRAAGENVGAGQGQCAAAGKIETAPRR